MDRDQKTAKVDEIAEHLGEAEAIFAVDYRGISVGQAADLRARLREADAVFKVVKNRLAKLAAEKAGTTELEELLDGPTALTLIKGDPVTAAKTISTFAREHRVLEFKGGIMDGAPLEPEKFQAIARLPALDVLHGQLVGMTASPLTGLARGLAAMMSGLAVALGEIREKGLVTGEAEAEAEAPAEEQEAEEKPPAEAEAPAEETETQAEAPAEEAEAPAEETETQAEAPAEEAEAPAEEAEAEPAATEEAETESEEE